MVLLRSFIIPQFRSELFSFPTPFLAFGAIANSTFIGADWIMFSQIHDGRIGLGDFHNSDFPLWHMLLVPQAWSLGIEISFYLCAPIIVKLSTKHLTVSFVFLVAIRSFSYIKGFDYDPWTYRFFPFEIMFFILGILLFRIKKSMHLQYKIPINWLAFFLGVIYLLNSFVLASFKTSRVIMLCLLVAVSIIVIVFSSDNKIDKRIGDYSYPFYISHFFVITSFTWLIGYASKKSWTMYFMRNNVFISFLMLSVSFLLSAILLRIVRPVESLRNDVRNHSIKIMNRDRNSSIN
jgi:hypothetical protein